MRRLLSILHTTELYPPSLGGSQEVVRQISERLARRGHKVVVATTRLAGREQISSNGVEVREFDISGNAVNGTRGEVEAYLDLIRSSDHDVMMNYSAQVWPTDLLLPLLDDLSPPKVLVPLGFSHLYEPGYSDYYQRMRGWLRNYDASVYLSNAYRDIEFARSVGADNTVVIPNGASEEEFSSPPGLGIRARLGIPEDHFLIILVGTHSGLKGHEEAIKIFQGAKIRRTTLLIIANDQGRGCGTKCAVMRRLFQADPRPHISEKKLIITELTREETVAAYHDADLFLFPSKVECSPLVLFEAMASGTPFMSTDVGNAGEIVDWSGGGILMPTMKDEVGYSTALVGESSRLLEELYFDIDRRNRMARSGMAAWRERFTWEAITQRYEDLYLALAEGEFPQAPEPDRRMIVQ